MNREEIFLEKINTFSDLRMPRWNDLPEIELYMDQVITVTDKYLGAFSVSGDPLLTPSMINNYVKNGVIPPPNKKKYSREHLAKLIVICILKPVMEISAIACIMEFNEKLFGTEKMLNDMSEMFEKRISALSSDIGKAFGKCDKTEVLLCAVSTENAVSAVTEKIIASYAYAAFKKEDAPAKSERKKDEDKNAVSSSK